jgi:hypothetical protein
MKLHAGHAVIVVMAIFILIMTQFMVRAYHNQETLVSEDYYAKEIRYQEQIDKMHNTSALGEAVQFEALPGRLVIDFPRSMHGQAITGELFLMRPSDVRSDLRVPITADADGRFTIDTGDQLQGAYSAHLEWQVAGNEYLTEEKVHLP